jgi:hypothetical protein
MAITLVLIIISLGCFIFDWIKSNRSFRKWAWRFFYSITAFQSVILAVLFFRIRSVTNPVNGIPEREYREFGKWLSGQMGNQIPTEMQLDTARNWIAERAAGLKVGMGSNPVEFGALIALFVLLVLVSLIALKREKVEIALPSLDVLDSLLYRTIGVAFPLLTLLLITGAVWANESWGRYWGWDPKEVGALVSWVAYAAYLHTRITHGWRGRRSAYFAILGFILVIFTWLGVSYLLPGLHSYA